MISAILKTKLLSLPKEAGIYMMKDSRKNIIYVGKAKNLKNRVSSYFNKNAQQALKTKRLVEEIYDLEMIITTNEVEALLLERTLIKHHLPKYNILLRDDKEYPYLRVNFSEEWPRIEKVRRRRNDGAQYLGPFSSGAQLKVMLQATYRIFPLIRCSRHEFSTAKRPCNYYNMRMCLAPCTLPVDRDQYRSMVQDAVAFLSGRNKEVLKGIKKKMLAASEAEQYELAALYRDQVKAFEQVNERQAVVVQDLDDADVFGFAQMQTRTAFYILSVRQGFLVSSDGFVLDALVQTPAEALTEFILQYYDARSIPELILLPFEPDTHDSLRLALLQSHPDTKKIVFSIPERGVKHDLIEMAQKNAQFKLEDNERSIHAKQISLEVLKDKLRLKRLPRRIECVDISNIQGSAIVASDVCFIDGKPAKDQYRHYTITSVQDGPNDFASIYETVRRRLIRGHKEQDLPDLLVIDGGRGQLSSACKAYEDVCAELRTTLDLDLISLAKSRPKIDKRQKYSQEIVSRSFERVFFTGSDAPLPLSPGTPEFRLLTQIRDEAHRFAITHHRKKRSKATFHSDLLEIPGLGPKLRQRLMETFGSLQAMQEASLDTLLQIQGITEKTAVALHSFLKGQVDSDSDETNSDDDVLNAPDSQLPTKG